MNSHRTKWKFDKTLLLEHDETPVILNSRTGEVKEIQKSYNRTAGNPDVCYHKKKDQFKKVYQDALTYLSNRCSAEEMGVIMKMIELIKFETNSMPPLDNERSVRELSTLFKINRRRVMSVLENLRQLGVYYTYNIVELEKNGRSDNKYWKLNPDIAFNGRKINKGILKDFEKTELSIVLRAKRKG